MTHDHYKTLKDTCNRACHERHACVSGYRQMLASENVGQMMATWRNNWEDVIDGKFADFIREHLPEQYPNIKEEMNAAGIYLNDCPQNANANIKVIITDTTDTIDIYGDAKAYVLGKATIIAHNHAQIYNNHYLAHITLLDYAYGHIHAGEAVAQGRSTLDCNCTAVINGAVRCTAHGGSVRAVKYREIKAYCNTIVYSNTNTNITLGGTAQITTVPDASASGITE